MNTQTRIQSAVAKVRRQQGMTLLDVLLAIIIFVVGMLALASLQGNLTRSSADANARTIGSNIAEELIEQFRTYEQLASADGVDAYQDIVDQTLTINRGGVDYTVDVTVEDWYNVYDPDSGDTTPTSDLDDVPEGRDTTISDFKVIELAVNWAGSEFQAGDGTETTGRLGSGAIRVNSVIASIPTLGPAKVAADEEGLGSPPTPYTPGDRPDIVAISLGDGVKFKESTTPEPIVRRQDELVETWFDVITYSQPGGEGAAVFLRREEFVAISCECTLQAAAADAGRLPTVWTGADYKEGALANKPYGVSANNQQSQYCDVCCRDHHDGNAGDTYRPWINGDQHQHYARERDGTFTAAQTGDDYLEACRLVRKDGFFRVAQDFNLQTQTAFPREFLQPEANGQDYSEFVIETAQNYLAPGNPDLPLAADHFTFEGDTPDNRLMLPSINPVGVSRQMMSRAIYVDELSSELSANLANCFGDNPNPDACTLPDGMTELEVLPFFDVQVTKLARWIEAPFEDPIDISNDDFDNNGYDRGLAELAGSEQGHSTVTSRIEKSNTGLIDTPAIGALPGFGHAVSNLYLQAGEAAEPPAGGTLLVSGTITAARNTSDPGAAMVVGSGDISCTRPGPGQFACYLKQNGVMPNVPHITVTGYYRNNTALLVCSNNSHLSPGVPAFVMGETNLENQSYFKINGSNLTGASLTINKNSCN